MKKRKFYVKPSMKVHELKQRAQLLQASASVSATMNGTWDEETIPEP